MRGTDRRQWLGRQRSCLSAESPKVDHYSASPPLWCRILSNFWATGVFLGSVSRPGSARLRGGFSEGGGVTGDDLGLADEGQKVGHLLLLISQLMQGAS